MPGRGRFAAAALEPKDSRFGWKGYMTAMRLAKVRGSNEARLTRLRRGRCPEWAPRFKSWPTHSYSGRVRAETVSVGRIRVDDQGASLLTIRRPERAYPPE